MFGSAAQAEQPKPKEPDLSELEGKKPVVLLFMRGFRGEFACFFCSTQIKEYIGAYRTDRETASYGSMTESAVSSLALCRLVKGTGKGPADAQIERGLHWIQTHFSVRENTKSAYQEGRLLYHLYALERVAGLLGLEQFGDRDWHREGGAYLLESQRADGSWDDGAETPVANTCFAVLFLTRATAALKP